MNFMDQFHAYSNFRFANFEEIGEKLTYLITVQCI